MRCFGDVFLWSSISYLIECVTNYKAMTPALLCTWLVGGNRMTSSINRSFEFFFFFFSCFFHLVTWVVSLQSFTVRRFYCH